MVHAMLVNSRFMICLVCALVVVPVLGALCVSGMARADMASHMVSDGVASKATKYMAATANPYATETALNILREGGSAVDAAIAVQMVLTLVEPQSSGIGGGGFMLHFERSSGNIIAYDGREKAPASAHERMFLRQNGEVAGEASGNAMGWHEAVVGGLSVGVPGVVRMLEMAHGDHGKLPWKRLFQPAIELARTGFPVSARMHELSVADEYLKTFETTAGYFLDQGNHAHPAGTILTNPALAETMEKIATGGADAFYTGAIAEGIAETVQSAPLNLAGLTTADLAAYTALRREAVCGPYRTYRVCGMPPPSSGGITTLQILGMLEHFPMDRLAPGSMLASHLIAEASRLAFADRNHYLADADFAPYPPGMTAPEYLRDRASLIEPVRATPDARPGNPGGVQETLLWPDRAEKGLSTTHFSIVDGDGNVVSMTSSIETQFGSRLMSGGFLLNNQLTDFAWVPEQDGKPVANRAEAHKRPRSSMSPTLVFDEQGQFVMALGSPGGSSIIGYVTSTLVGILDQGLNMQQAIDLPHILNKNGPTYLEAGTAMEALKPVLEAMGHTVEVRKMTSGLQGIRATGGGLEGGADPRREGVAAGD